MQQTEHTIVSYGFRPEDYPTLSPDSIARVTAVHRERYELVSNRGFCYARLKAGSFYATAGSIYPTVGDYVRYQPVETGDSLVLETLARRSKFARSDFSSENYVSKGGEQLVAANFETVFLVMSLNQDFNARRLERYLALAWQSGAMPVILLTKADLVAQREERLAEAESVAFGVPVYPVSAITGEGIEELQTYLTPGKTVVLLGSSGVGKSTLVNALAGEELMAVQSVREQDDKGRHTTTHRQLFRLPSGGLVIDTPGMRELGMWEATDGLSTTFEDVEQYFGQCRFRDCAHDKEPGCAVQAAIAAGELPAARWKSYRSLQREMLYHEDKAAYARLQREQMKGYARIVKDMRRGNKLK